MSDWPERPADYDRRSATVSMTANMFKSGLGFSGFRQHLTFSANHRESVAPGTAAWGDDTFISAARRMLFTHLDLAWMPLPWSGTDAHLKGLR
jgi:hypothetical protein